MTSQGEEGPMVVLEGALCLKGRILFCTRWKRKYVRVRADTKQLAIYDKKVSATSTGKRGECLLIQLKQVVECKARNSSKKQSSFLLQKTANAGASRKIIFRCADPADRDRWIHVINDVMNGKTIGPSEFDEVVVSTSALTHLGKQRPKNPGRRPPRNRQRAVVTPPPTEINGFGDDADSGVGASSELLATHAAVIVHKSDDEAVDDVVQQSPTSQESVQPPAPARQVSTTESITDMDIPDTTPPKSEKLSSLQRLKRQKKSGDNSGAGKVARSEKSPSIFSRLGNRISRALGVGQTPDGAGDNKKDAQVEKKRIKENADIPEQDEPRKDEPKKDQPKPEKPETKAKPKKALKPNKTAVEESEHRTSRDTYHAMSPAMKSGHDKVVLELAAIARNAKLVAEKAEALKSARLQSEGDSSGDETNPASPGAVKSLSRRDSEKNIEQAAENLRTTLKNLSEAELLEIEKQENEDEDSKTSEERVPEKTSKEEEPSGEAAIADAEPTSDAKPADDAKVKCSNEEESGRSEDPGSSEQGLKEIDSDNDKVDKLDKNADEKEKEEDPKEVDGETENESGNDKSKEPKAGEEEGQVPGKNTEENDGENDKKTTEEKDLNAKQEPSVKIDSEEKDDKILANGNMSENETIED